MTKATPQKSLLGSRFQRFGVYNHCGKEHGSSRHGAGAAAKSFHLIYQHEAERDFQKLKAHSQKHASFNMSHLLGLPKQFWLGTKHSNI